MIINNERIELMDKVFGHMVAHYIDHNDKRYPCDDLYMKMFSISRDLSKWLIKRVAETGHNLGFLVSQEHGYGNYSIVSMNRIDCVDFQSSGGFKEYYRDVNADLSCRSANIHSNGKNNNIVVGDNNVINVTNKGGKI